MAHDEADKDAAVAAVLLLGAVVEVNESQGPVQNLAHLAGGEVGLSVVGAAERVVVKGDAVKGRHQQQGPVATALSDTDVTVVVDGQEDVGDLGEVG